MFNELEKVWERTFRFAPVKPWRSRLWKLYLSTLVATLPSVAMRALLAVGVPFVLSKLLPIGVFLINVVFEGGEATALEAPLVILSEFNEFCSSPLFVFWLAFGPWAWSAAAFVFPGSGWFWHRSVGAYEPSSSEQERIWTIIQQLPEEVQREIAKLEILVVDSPAFFPFVRGRTIVISRALLESRHAPGTLVHETGHCVLMDARFIQALDRLGLWGDILRERRENLEELQRTRPVGRRFRGWRIWLYSLTGSWVFRTAGGRELLESDKVQVRWAAAWRKGEELADAYVAYVGLGIPLAQFMEQHEVPRDKPNPRGLFDLRPEPRWKERADELTQMATGKRPERFEELAQAMAWMS